MSIIQSPKRPFPFSIIRDKFVPPDSADPRARAIVTAHPLERAQALDLVLNEQFLRPPEVVVVFSDHHFAVERHRDVIAKYGLTRDGQQPGYEDPGIQQLAALVNQPPEGHVWAIVYTSRGQFAFQIEAIARRTVSRREVLDVREMRERRIADEEAAQRAEFHRIEEERRERERAARARRKPPAPPRRKMRPASRPKEQPQRQYPPVERR